jgi:hypothetical protein
MKLQERRGNKKDIAFTTLARCQVTFEKREKKRRV